MVNHLLYFDPGTGADFVHSNEVLNKLTDKRYIYSGVNLFRILFSYLGKEKKYLNNLQNDGSYISLKKPKGIYRYINDQGDIVFEKL